MSQRLVANSLWNLATFLVATVVSFFSVRLFIAHLGFAQYGLLAILSTLVAPLGLLNFGLGQATVKYVAECFARADRAGAACFLRTTLFFNLVVGLAGALAMAAAAGPLARYVFKVPLEEQSLLQHAIYWTAATWLLAQLTATLVAVPTARQDYRLVSLGTTLFSTLNVVFSILALVLGGGLIEVVQVRLAWAIAGLAFWIWIVARTFPGEKLWPAWHTGTFKQSMGFGLWQTVAQLGGVVANQTDKFLLGAYVSAEAVGIFNVPMVFFTTSYTAISKLAETLFPAFSDLQGRGEHVRAVGVLLRSGWVITLLMVAVQGTLTVFAEDVLRLYLSHPVEPVVALVLRITAFVAVISAPSMVVSQYLMGIGETGWLAAISVASGVVTLLGGLWLVPAHGLAGAAWSDLAAIVLTRPLLHDMIWRRRLRPLVSRRDFLLSLYGASVAGVPVTLLLAMLRDRVAWTPGWLGLLGAGLAVGGLILVTSLLWDGLMPGGAERRAELVRLVGKFSRRLT